MTVGAIDSSVYANNYYLATGNTNASNYNSYASAVSEAQSFNDLLAITGTTGTTSSTSNTLSDSALDTVSLSPAALNILEFLQDNNIGNVSNDNTTSLLNNSGLTQTQQAELTNLLQTLGLSSQQQAQIIAVFTQFTAEPTTQDPTAISQTEAQNEAQTGTNTAPTASPAPATTDNTNQTTTPDANPNNSNIAYSAPDSREALMQSFISGYVQQPLPPEHNKRQFSQT